MRWQQISWCVVFVALALSVSVLQAQELDYRSMAGRIVTALEPAVGERVLLRFDPETMPDLRPMLQAALEERGASVEAFAYGPAPDLDSRLAQADIYIWLPAGPNAQTPADQRAALAQWLGEGRGRQVHFHWGEGTRDPDGLSLPHTPAYDRVYFEALDIDYASLSASMNRAMAVLRSGEVRVTTPAGTDIRFQIGNRPFNKQDGDASRGRMASARTLVDREIELPAGVLRVAPLEETAIGVIVVPSARFDGVRAEGIRLEFTEGRVVAARAEVGDVAFQTFLQSAPGATRFREFGLGFNRKLKVPEGGRALPYYGYGAGVVRMSLGDNAELGGTVRGGGVRWLFFPDTTVTVDGVTLVENGQLAPLP